MEVLKNCPRCDSSFIVVGSDDKQYQVFCGECRLIAKPARTQAGAVRKWNNTIKIKLLKSLINKLLRKEG